MSDDIQAVAEVLAEIRLERTPRKGEHHWEFEARLEEMRQRSMAEYGRLRDRIVELATSDAPDREIRQQLKQLAEGILVRRAAYAEWRKEFRASTRAPAGP